MAFKRQRTGRLCKFLRNKQEELFWRESLPAIGLCNHLWRRREQFNHVPVRVVEKDLPRAIRPLLPRTKLRSNFSKVLLPRIQLNHAQCEMVAAIAGSHRLGATPNEMQFLVHSQLEPRAWKSECRSRNLLKLQHSVVEFTTPFHINNVERDVIQF